MKIRIWKLSENTHYFFSLAAFSGLSVTLPDTAVFLILAVIYHILINFNDLANILKTPKYSEKFKKLNRALSYLSFNINYSEQPSQSMSLIGPEIVGERLFKITNLLFIESLQHKNKRFVNFSPKNIISTGK